MNGIWGVQYWHGKEVSEQLLTSKAFLSPLWQPEHQDVWHEGSLGFACTQRLITPECKQGLMPYKHPTSGCVIAADAFLTNRKALIEKLNTSRNLADGTLILEAYLKWGTDCCNKLEGDFFFSIWDPNIQQLFLATDQFATRPFFYSYEPKKYFIFANYMSPFKGLLPQLSINDALFEHFALDAFKQGETCYREVKKSEPAQQFIITKEQLSKKNYWELKRQGTHTHYKKREDYYQHFTTLFTQATQACLRSDFNICSHISGGLDSSSITAMAAKLLAEQQQTLYAFTAIPQKLEGPSYRKGWYYHEMPQVQSVLDSYPNIEHFKIHSSRDTDLYQLLAPLYPLIDQPYRNIANFDWILSSLAQANALNSRTLLTGQKGNGSISWTGLSNKNKAKIFLNAIRTWMHPQAAFNEYYDNHNPEFLNSKTSRAILRNHSVIFDMQNTLLTGRLTAPILSSMYPVMLWYGVQQLDPSNNLPLCEFCYSIPQWVYYKGSNALERRLLVRDGLATIVPQAIRHNPYRGEQAAEWYLQFNQHASVWKKRLAQTENTPIGDILWRLYDRAKILNLFPDHPIKAPDKNNTRDIACNLMRCISMATFLEFILS